MFQVGENQITKGEDLTCGRDAIRIAGDCCHRWERSGNVCGFAKQEKLNSAGATPANLGNAVSGSENAVGDQVRRIALMVAARKRL